MTLDGVTGKTQIWEEQIVNHNHPPVILTGAVKTGQGALKAGTIVIKDSGKLAAYNGSGTPIGILTETCAADQASALYLAHGLAESQKIIKGDGTPATMAEFDKLAAAGIYGV